MRTARSSFTRVRIALDRPRLWRVTTAVAALLLCALLVVAAQGSVDVIGQRAQASIGTGTSWERWCTRGAVREDRVRIAFCARINGIVVYSNRGPGPGEAHVAVVGAFHLTVVKLPTGAAIPAVGSRVLAIGPVFRARNGQREVQAFRLQRS